MKFSAIILLFVLLACINTKCISQDLAREYQKQAIKMVQDKKYHEAIKVATNLIRLQPNNANAWYIRGFSRFQLEDYENAIKDFDKTIELNPEYSDAYIKRGKAKRATDNYWGALRDFIKARNSDPYYTFYNLVGDAF